LLWGLGICRYDPVDAPWPGTVISTGTEDYFDSGWYVISWGEQKKDVRCDANIPHTQRTAGRLDWQGGNG